MENSTFNTLPPELPNNVRAIVWSGAKATQSHPLAILETCSTIRREATQLFYAINHFEPLSAEDEDKREMLEAFFVQIGRQNVKALQNPLIVHVGHYKHEDVSLMEIPLSRAMAQLLFSIEVHTKLPSVKVKGHRHRSMGEDIKARWDEARLVIKQGGTPVAGSRSLSEHYKRLDYQLSRALCLSAVAKMLIQYRRAKTVDT
ncbi:hypothetical protein Tdes44962_MAKER02894 [Teratosphaeria destructans]|uniref:Uncharacterized protein n=1 Tax=Teratosphaeria destructans TaxID=418781 RepID=A0A9W7SRU5_9PEZI|nr:hypothetical protein Tdes44962_MAKER02894 [Teratosphaeria destructans]